MNKVLNDSSEINPTYISEQVKLLKEKINNIQQYNPEDNILILIGCTGAGKTSLSYLLANEQLISVSKHTGYALEPTRKIKGLDDVGHDCIAKTYVPGYIKIKNNVIIDFAGIGDNRGINLRIINALITQEMIPKGNCKLRVLLVMSAPEIQAHRGKTAVSIFEAVESFISPKQWESTLGIIITKIDKKQGMKAQGLINYMKGGEYKGQLLNFFSIHPSNVFEFPLPDSLGSYNPPKMLIDALFNFIQSAPISSSTNRGLLIDMETLKDLFNTWNQITYDYQNQITGPFGLLSEIKKTCMTNINSIEKINRLIKQVNDLINGIKKGMDEFEIALKNCNSDLLPNKDEILRTVKIFTPLNNFFEDFQKYSNILKKLNMKSPIINFTLWTYEALQSELTYIQNAAKYSKDIEDLREKERNGEISRTEMQKQIDTQVTKIADLEKKNIEEIQKRDALMDDLKIKSDQEISQLKNKLKEIEASKQNEKVIETVVEKPIYQVIERVIEKDSGCILI